MATALQAAAGCLPRRKRAVPEPFGLLGFGFWVWGHCLTYFQGPGSSSSRCSCSMVTDVRLNMLSV